MSRLFFTRLSLFVVLLSTASAFMHARPSGLRRVKVLKMAADPTKNLKKADFLDLVVARTSASKKDVDSILSASLDVIMESVADGKKVTFLGFGSFEGRDRKARTGRNPKTGDVIEIAATRTPAFSAAKSFKDRVKAEL